MPDGATDPDGGGGANAGGAGGAGGAGSDDVDALSFGAAFRATFSNDAFVIMTSQALLGRLLLGEVNNLAAGWC